MFSYQGDPNTFFQLNAQPSQNRFDMRMHGSNRPRITDTTCEITGDLTVSGNVTAPNVQEKLSSVADDGTIFHTVLGTSSATNKLKAISGTSGVQVLPLFDTINFECNPLNFVVAYGAEDATLT